MLFNSNETEISFLQNEQARGDVGDPQRFSKNKNHRVAKLGKRKKLHLSSADIINEITTF